MRYVLFSNILLEEGIVPCSDMTLNTYTKPYLQFQAHGSPPEDIMGPLPPGFSLDPEGLPQIPDGCVVS